MSRLSANKSVKYGNFTFRGHSSAGIFTAISCKELSLSFDVGNGAHYLIPMKNYFISHGHADHASGLPYLLSMKALAKQPPAQVYLPEALHFPMEKILKLWQEIEGHEYSYQLNPIPEKRNDDFSLPLKGSYFVKPFTTFHRVQSCGYTVFEKKKKLRPEFHNCSRDEILQSKKQGQDIHLIQETPLVSFTGDTTIDFWNHCPWVKKSQTLFMEVSFIDDQRSIEETRHWGHIHLDELLPLIEDFEGENLVLIHLSQRHSTDHLEQRLNQKLSQNLRKKVFVFPR